MLSSIIGIYLIFGFLMAGFGLAVAPRDATAFELLAGGIILMVIWPFALCVMIYNFLTEE